MTREAQQQIVFQALLAVGRDEYNARKDSFVILEAPSNLVRFVALQLAMTTNSAGRPAPEAVSAVLQRAGFTTGAVA
jgi:hypothetical protein